MIFFAMRFIKNNLNVAFKIFFPFFWHMKGFLAAQGMKQLEVWAAECMTIFVWGLISTPFFSFMFIWTENPTETQYIL